MTLQEVLAANRDEVMQLWKKRVRGTLAPESMPPIELLDHMPAFLEEILRALREGAVSSRNACADLGTSAAGHGEQRLRLGFSLDSVVHEYGALSAAIIATAIDAGAKVSLRELEIVVHCVIAGIAQAVTEYTHQRDAELRRQANEHFAFIAHELRSPLSAASMAAQQLRSAGVLSADVRAAGILERGLQRASELIDQTLQVARVASGIELRREWTTLSALLRDVELEATAEAESKGVDLRVALDKDERVEVDVRLIRSAIGNLVRNGVKYTHPGGTVELRGGLTDGRLKVEIEDRCGGLEPGQVEEAFAPFVRLDARQSGFGLGLAIAKQAVDAHGGSIRVQNLPGKGCVFVLELPVDADDSAA